MVVHFEQIKQSTVYLSPSLANHPDSKVHGANMGPTWVLLAPDGPHVVRMTLAIEADQLDW